MNSNSERIIKKFVAYQQAPEYQESPLFINDGEFFPEDISVFGNREYSERYSDEIRPIMKSLKDNQLDWEMECTENINDEREVLSDWFSGINKIDDEKIHELSEIIRDSSICYRQDELCAIFRILTGKNYDYDLIRGSSQGDWNYVFYIQDDWNEIAIDQFATEYFNTGTEWLVYEDEQDVCPVSYYTHWWSIDSCRDELAEMIGCKSEEIQMFEFDGWSRSPKYKEYII